jgi:hypothetical protein
MNNKKELDKLFSVYVENARKRVAKRKRFNNIYISQYNYHHSSCNKAMFIVRNGIHFIELYKPAIIEHYLTYYPEYISFDLYFTSLIIHEIVHRQQYQREFNCNFKLFNIMYQCDKDKYENKAREVEKHFIEYMLKRKPHLLVQ